MDNQDSPKPFKKIVLSNGGFALVDEEDYEKAIQYKWMRHRIEINREIVETTTKPRLFLSRFIMNPSEGMQVDHIDGNTFNNRKSNLRICTNAENSRNTKLYSTNTTGFRGVIWDKDLKRWKVRITVDFKRIYLGSYRNIEDAAKAYDKAALKYHGEFASLNFDP